MQFTKIAFLASIASLASAQAVTINDLPTCALAPAVQAIGSTGCGTDIACVCKDSSFLASLTPLIKAACSAADFQKAITVAGELCAQAGVTITPPSTPATSTPVVVSAPTTSVPATSAPAVTSAIPTTSVVPTTTSLATVTTSTPPKNGTVTSALPSVVTANAAAGHGTWAAAGLLGIGAVLAAF